MELYFIVTNKNGSPHDAPCLDSSIHQAGHTVKAHESCHGGAELRIDRAIVLSEVELATVKLALQMLAEVGRASATRTRARKFLSVLEGN